MAKPNKPNKPNKPGSRYGGKPGKPGSGKPGSGKPGSKPPKISRSEQIRLGPRVAALKASTAPAEWKRIVQNAHKRGYTVEGATSGVPDALKERTRSSLTAEATKTVDAAFKPASRTLDHQEEKVKALSAKRAADENHFQEWLANQHASMTTRALTADAEMGRRQAEIQAQTREGYASAQAGALQAAGATAGNVSNPAQATALNLAPEAQRANDQVAAQRLQSATMSNNAAGYAIAARGVGIGLSQQATAKRKQDESAGLAEVAKDRAVLMDKRASVAAEEISRLFGVEIQKADSNRNYLAAADKLGIAARGQDLAASKAAADRASREAIAVAGINAAADINNADNATSTANNAADNATSTANNVRSNAPKPPKPTGPAKPATPAEKRLSNEVSNRLGKIVSDIGRERKNKNRKRTLRETIEGRGASKAEYEIALDLADDGKLSPINQRRAEAMGLIVTKNMRAGAPKKTQPTPVHPNP